jgi:hypothetical protein
MVVAEQLPMSTHLALSDHVRPSVEWVRVPIDVDVRLTPATTDGAAWAAQLVTVRAKSIFQADEIIVSGAMWTWLVGHALAAGLVVD